MKNVKDLLVILLFIVYTFFSINITPTTPSNPLGTTSEEILETDEISNEITPLHDNAPPGVTG